VGRKHRPKCSDIAEKACGTWMSPNILKRTKDLVIRYNDTEALRRGADACDIASSCALDDPTTRRPRDATSDTCHHGWTSRSDASRR